MSDRPTDPPQPGTSREDDTVEQRLVAPRDSATSPNPPPPPRDIDIASPSPSFPTSTNPNFALDLRAQMRERARERRAEESGARRQARVEGSRLAMAERRARESEEERRTRLAVAQANRQRLARNRRVRIEESAFNYDFSYDYSSHPLLNIGAMDVECLFDSCRALRFPDEALGICCQGGSVQLSPLRQPHEPISLYFAGDDALQNSRHFLDNIRHYNSCFQMTSFNANVINHWSTFQIQGQVYHSIGPLEPVANQPAKFVQIYFMGDSGSEADRRLEVMNDHGIRLNAQLIQLFQSMLHDNNSLIRSFKTARELLSDSPAADQNLRIGIRAEARPAGEHERQYNAPVVDEVAAILVQGELNRRDIVLHLRNNNDLSRIDESHRYYDALQYPLIYPYGDESWHFDLKQHNSPRRVTPRSYYAFRFSVRPNDFNFIHRCRKLLCQYAVDMYAKIEAQRLLFLRQNQTKLRADTYKGFADALSNSEDLSAVGKVILPATHIGSPRHMQEYKQDALSYVRLHGRADFFITMTCNPNWPEITNHLFLGQSANDRHDIIARVFERKVRKLLACIKQHKMFGDAKCGMYTIEWQKRGLPHMHMLIWLTTRIHPERVDQVICAELPDPQVDPILFDIVSRNMIHTPCLPVTRRPQPCIKDGKCTKRYPRRFVEETQTAEDGYPLYRRRSPEQGGQSFQRDGHVIDNSWVVPYNPTLSKMFNSHINVEACHSVKSIKYICKYITKGSDMAAFGTVANENDEITQFQIGRYINANEAFWRIFKFDMHERWPAVTRLAVHLPGEQFMAVNVAAAPERIRAGPPRTTLTSFFELCQTDEFAKTILYQDVPRYFTLQGSKKWARRKKVHAVPGYPGVFSDNTIGRVYSVSAKDIELNRLRLLLVQVPGPTSYEYLRTVDDVLHPTFQAACIARGLLESDSHWEDTLTEAAVRQMPCQMRDLFVCILTHSEPSDPLSLWEKFKDSMSEDILFRLRNANPDLNIEFNDFIYNEALVIIEDGCYNVSGRSLNSFGLPVPNRDAQMITNPHIIRETSYNSDALGHFADTNRPLLTDDQRLVYETLSSAIIDQTGGIYFLDAPGGTGKTFIINLLLAEVRSRKEIILATASSGIAATLIAGGRTAHSTFGIPLDIHQYEGSKTFMKKNDAKAELLKRCKCIVWDECTMAHKNSLWGLDLTLRDIRDLDVPFGGVVILLSGDFRQTLPVIRQGTAADAFNACLKQSHLWTHVRRMSLTTNMRVHLRQEEGAAEFAQQLLQIGEGRCPHDAHGLMPFTNDMSRPVTSTEALIEAVFPNLQSNLGNRTWQSERSILAPLNEIVHELNYMIQAKLTDRVSRFYNSIDQVVDPDESINFPVEFLNSLNPPGFPPHQLEIKVGSTVMVLRNLMPPKICNGTRLRVKSTENNLICGTILAGENKGEDVFISRVKLITTDDAVEFSRLQFPLRLAFAMTINKSQGQSLGVVGIDLSSPCFSHGQLYVACSRVGSPGSMYVHAPDNKTRNVIFPAALR